MNRDLSDLWWALEVWNWLSEACEEPYLLEWALNLSSGSPRPVGTNGLSLDQNGPPARAGTLRDEREPLNTEMDICWPLVSFNPGTAGSLSHLRTAVGTYVPLLVSSKTTQRIDKWKQHSIGLNKL